MLVIIDFVGLVRGGNMSRLKIQVPVGTGDFLPDECRAKRKLEATFRESFRLNGYHEIETPSFEYYDVFMQKSVPYVQENMIKFFDREGRILALRPDMTGPIARIAATHLLEQSSVQRLCYIGNVFGFKEEYDRAERTQAGVELIGKKGAIADAEVIAVAIQSLLQANLDDFKIDIGQVAFFKGLIEDANLSEEQQEKLRLMVDTKNTVDLEYEISRLSLTDDVRESLLELPNLFGGKEVLKQANDMARNKSSQFAVQNIQEVYNILCDYGYEEYISIDFGLLSNFNYYSGILFRGIADGIGVPILSGGRYDELTKEFGKEAAATGFAIGIRELLIVLESQGKLTRDNGKIKIIRCDAKTRTEAYKYAQQLRSEGERVVMETNGATYDKDAFETIDF